MPLDCPSCHAPLQAKDVRLDLALATCQACGAVHDLSGRKTLESSRAVSSKPPPRPKLVLPTRIRIDTEAGSTHLSWRWFNLQYLFMAVFCACWDGFLLVWYGLALSSSRAPLIMLLFPLLHVGVGVGLTYSTLAGFLNRTRIDVDRDRLRIRHGPLPWKGNLELPGRQLAQLYVEPSTRLHTRRLKPTYDLMALDRDGIKVRLLSGLDEKDLALFLEQELERRLGIEDAPVRGAIEA